MESNKIELTANGVKERDTDWLAKEKERQLNRLVGRIMFDDREVDGLNLHIVLGITKEEYIDSIPPIPPQPEQWHSRFDLPVLIDPRISPNDWLHRIGYIGIGRIGFKEKLHKGIKIPKVPYWIWSQDATNSRYIDISAEDWWQRECAEDERGQTLREMLSTEYLQSQLRGRDWWLGAPGSVIERKVNGRNYGDAFPHLDVIQLKPGGNRGIGIVCMPIDRKDQWVTLLSCGDWQKIENVLT